MESIVLMTANEFRGRLASKGTSLKTFAMERGYNVNTVQKTAKRYVGKGAWPPRGLVSKAILEDLQAFMEGVEDEETR